MPFGFLGFSLFWSRDLSNMATVLMWMGTLHDDVNTRYKGDYKCFPSCQEYSLVQVFEETF